MLSSEGSSKKQLLLDRHWLVLGQKACKCNVHVRLIKKKREKKNV
jgi:hypothetical protein